MNERVKVLFCPVLPEIWKNIVFFKVPRFRPLVLLMMAALR